MPRRVPFVTPLILIAGVVLLVGALRYLDAVRAPSVSLIDQKFDELRLRPVTERDHYQGSLDAPVQLIVFSDTECPYCKHLHMTVLPALKREFGSSIVIAYRHHLRPQFTRSPREAEATECAALIGGEEAFWRFLNRIYEVTPSEDKLDPKELYSIAEFTGVPSDTFTECLESGTTKARVTEDRGEADRNEIVTAPTVVVRGRGKSPLYLPGSYLGPLRGAILSALAR